MYIHYKEYSISLQKKVSFAFKLWTTELVIQYQFLFLHALIKMTIIKSKLQFCFESAIYIVSMKYLFQSILSACAQNSCVLQVEYHYTSLTSQNNLYSFNSFRFSLVYFCISFFQKYNNLQQNVTGYKDKRFT